MRRSLALSLPVCAMMARKATGERGECDGEGEKAEKTGEGQTGCCSLPPFLPLYSPAPKVDKQSDAAAMCIIFGARGLNHENSIKEMESRQEKRCMRRAKERIERLDLHGVRRKANQITLRRKNNRKYLGNTAWNSFH